MTNDFIEQNISLRDQEINEIDQEIAELKKLPKRVAKKLRKANS